MIVHRAAWVLPVTGPPIRDGWVAVERGRIVALGGPSDPLPAGAGANTPPAESRVILPALVNAHVHLELSWMRGSVPPASTMPAWASQLVALRRTIAAEPDAPIRAAIEEARAAGTALVGDVTNTVATHEPLSRSPLSAMLFFEQLGFRTAGDRQRARDAHARVSALPVNARIRAAVVPHAPYSVSPSLLQEIARLDAPVVSIHLAESAEERQFLADGTGAWRTLLESLGLWDEGWTPPACDPVEYIARAGLLDERLLAVHCVQLTDAELARLASVGATVVTCPRSNVWTGAGMPPIERFYASGVRVAVGTDSLASVDDLNLFSELAAMRAVAPEVAASRLIESATRCGAEALGFGADLGTLAPGKRAEIVAVRLPAACDDMEEYLVRGIPADAVSWLDAG